MLNKKTKREIAEELAKLLNQNNEIIEQLLEQAVKEIKKVSN